jgi:hypothetical protein
LEEVKVNKKLFGIFICAIMISGGLITIFRQPDVKADTGIQWPKNSIGLDLGYLWNVTNHVSNVVHTSYNGTDIRKGRFFGSKGDKDTADYINSQLIIDCSFGSQNVKKIRIKPIVEGDYNSNYYSDVFDVNATSLTINTPGFLNKPGIHDRTIQTNDFYPLPAVLNINGNERKTFSFNDSRVLALVDFDSLFPKWLTGLNPLNLSYTAQNNDTIIGNVTYIPTNESMPTFQSYDTVYLIDEVEGCSSKLENITNASGAILLHDNSIGDRCNTSNYNFPIVRVSSSENNVTRVKQLLENHTTVFADTTIYNNLLTFAYDFNSPLCYPGYKFSILFNFSSDESYDCYYIAGRCLALFLRDKNHGENPSVIIYDGVNQQLHNMFAHSLNWYRNPAMPFIAIPGVSVNRTIGEFLRDHSPCQDNTISGYITEIYRHENHESIPPQPAAETYDVAAYLNITKSPQDKTIVISNRYDSMWGECPGDSGCGTGIVMGIAKYFKDYNITPKYNLTFLFTTGEEEGYRGAQYYSDLHENDNIIKWIGFDQLGIHNISLVNYFKNPIDNQICREIANETNYTGRTHYNIENDTVHYGIIRPKLLGNGAEDIVFFQRKNNCDTILIHKDGKWDSHHRRGLNLTQGDVLTDIDRNDINVTYEFGWSVVKYFTVNPNCWFSTKSYEAVDSNGGTIPDSLKATFTVKSVLPNDCVLVNASLYDASTEQLVPGEYQEMTLVVNRPGVEHNVTLTMPTNVKEGDYYIKLEVYNSTARINRLADLDYSANDSNTSSTFHLNHYHTLGDIRIGTSNQNVHNSIRASKFTLTEDALVHNITAYVYGCLLSYPIYQCMIYRASDGHLIASTAQTPEYTLGWHTFSFYPKPVLSKNTQYLLSIWGNNDNSKVYYTTINYGNGYHNESYTFGSPPQTIGWGMSVALKQYSIFCSYTLNLPPEIINVSNSPGTVGFGYNVTINTNVTDDYNNITSVKVNITYPNHSYGNYSMAHIIGNHYRCIFSNTWFVGQYNYTIWAADNASNVNSSSGYHFHVSANATMSIATLKDSYSGTQYINVTDPPNPPDNFTLIGRGLTWNAYYNASSSDNILESYQGPVNYQENNGSWTPINNTLYQLTNNHPAYNYGYRVGNDHGLFGAYFKSDVSGDWPVAFRYNRSENPNYVVRSKLVGVGYVDPQSNWAYHYLQSVQSSQGQTNGNSVTYPNIFTGVDVTWNYNNIELKEAITISNATKTVLQNHPPSSYGLHDATSYLVFITKLDYQNLDVYNMSGLLTGNVTISDVGVDFKDVFGNFKCGLPLGDAYELNNESARHGLTYRIIHYNGNTYLLSGLKLTDLNTMVFPVVIDPTLTVYSTSSDGYIYNSGTNYNTVRTASSGTVDSTGTYISIGQKTGAGSTYYIYRGFVFFNTSALPSNAYLDSATLSLYKKDDYSTTDFDITVQNGQPTYPHNPMQSSDYNKNNYAGNGGSLNTAQFTNGYNDIRLTSLTWITKGGTTKLCLRSSRDINGNTPTGNEYVTVYAHEYPDMGRLPKLVIIYRNQSKIKNTGTTSIKGYLLIQVQYYNTSQGKWLVDKDTINETSPRTINIGNQLALDTIFNGRVRASDLTHGTGTYRVYAAFRDPEGNILKTNSGVELKAWWQFNKT